MTLGEVLRCERENKRLTMSYVADKINKTEVSMHRYETDQRKPSFDTVAKIAKIYNISLDYIADCIERW
jgi:transcriptional regulator with XRE-family HTH domain